MEKKECVCFAYYCDNVFLGWYCDSFGSIGKLPKVYGNSESQISTIKSNFFYKMQKINDSTFEQALTKAEGIEAIKLLVFSSEKVLRGFDVELRMVPCPVYSGPNPDFDAEAYKKYEDERDAKMRELGIFDLPAGSMRRMISILAFEKENPPKERNSWIYPDQKELQEFASKEPEGFILSFKYTNESKSKKNVVEKEETGDVEDTFIEETTE